MADGGEHGFLGLGDGAGRWHALRDDEAGPSDAPPPRARPRLRPRAPSGLSEDGGGGGGGGAQPGGAPTGVAASVQGDAILRALLPLPLRAMIHVWPYFAALVLAGNVVILFTLHQIWGQGHAYAANEIEPANGSFCSKPYDWYRNGDLAILVPLLALPEALRLRRFCLHSTSAAFSAPLADLYASTALLTPESWQATLAVSAGRCALAMGACVLFFLCALLPLSLSSSALHYPQRIARLAAYRGSCGSDWWFGQVPDIFLLAIDLPLLALVFVPYFVSLHAAEGVRLAVRAAARTAAARTALALSLGRKALLEQQLQAYAAEFEQRVSPAQRDEGAMAETLTKHQALELLLEHAQLVLEPALRWLLLCGAAAVLGGVTWAWAAFALGRPEEALAVFGGAALLALALLPLLRAVERVNSFQPTLERLAFSVPDPEALGAALPSSISHAAMLREYVKQHALELPVGGLHIRPSSLLSSSALASAFALVMIPFLVLLVPRFFGDAHRNAFKRAEEEMLAGRGVYVGNSTKPLCVYCGSCGYHGWCAGGYYTGPGYEGCRWEQQCQVVRYAAEIMTKLDSGATLTPEPRLLAMLGRR